MAASRLTLFLLLGLVVVAGCLAVEEEAGGQGQVFKRKREAGDFRYEDAGLGGRGSFSGDSTLLEKLLRAPSKRQLCMPGYSYNVVMGDCFPSIGILKGQVDPSRRAGRSTN